MKTIYLVGNALVPEDALPLHIKEQLVKQFPNITFKEFDPTENLPEDSPELTMIDTVQGIDRVCVFREIDSFSSQKAYSMHDFDLGWQLKLYKKMGKVEKVTIIGIPMGMDENTAYAQVAKEIGRLM
ncbi:hypothetical protein GF369_01695 [Candidatus Peregrinibacteria bacterium]|nr:hypothetical protein [Candidatus Peregrinibacteria bacterium]